MRPELPSVAIRPKVQQDLKMRLEQFIREARGEPLVSARQYLEYLNALRSVIELARACDS
jgi:hypothetical protein